MPRRELPCELINNAFSSNSETNNKDDIWRWTVCRLAWFFLQTRQMQFPGSFMTSFAVSFTIPWLQEKQHLESYKILVLKFKASGFYSKNSSIWKYLFLLKIVIRRKSIQSKLGVQNYFPHFLSSTRKRSSLSLPKICSPLLFVPTTFRQSSFCFLPFGSVGFRSGQWLCCWPCPLRFCHVAAGGTKEFASWPLIFAIISASLAPLPL